MQIPLIILTGFLGAGKTTMLNHLSSQLPNLGDIRVALIENELGSAFGVVENELSAYGTIPTLVNAHDNDKTLNGHGNHLEFHEILEFGFGCVCCSSSAQFKQLLHSIKEAGKSTHVILETTGLADPSPIVQVIEEDLSQSFQVAQVVTVVDVSQILDRIEERTNDDFKNEPLEQILAGDTIILNKIDLVDLETLSKIESMIKDLNPTARIISTSFGKIDVTDLLNFPRTSTYKQKQTLPHDSNVAHTALLTTKPVDLEKVTQLVSDYQKEHPLQLYRVKGLLLDKNGNKILVQGVGEHGLTFFNRGPWPKNEERSSSLAIIGKDVLKNAQELDKKFSSCTIE